MMSEDQSPVQRLRASGWTLDVEMCEGTIIPGFILDKVKTLRACKLRQDDVLLVSYPKTGTHWMWEILKMVVAGSAEYAEHWQNSSWLEYRAQEDLDKLPSPRVLHTHLQPKFMPSCLWEGKCKIVYLKRNPKDVSVSMFNHWSKQAWGDQPGQEVSYAGTWENLLQLFWHEDLPFAPYFAHLKEWSEITGTQPNVEICPVNYEDLKKDCFKEVKRIAEFLGRPLPDQTCRDIVDACSFHKLKHASENTKDQTFHVKWTKNSEGYFRKGVVGDWKNRYTVSQSEKMESVYEEKMKQKYPY